jgi:hypothetical protein
VGTYFATSWVYYGLTKVHYFNLINLILFDEPKMDSLDSFVLAIGQLIVLVVGGTLVLVTPPALVYLLLRKLHGKSSPALEPVPPIEEEFPAKTATTNDQGLPFGTLPPKIDANQIEGKLGEILTANENLMLVCQTSKSMKTKISIFTNQRIILLETKALQISNEYSLHQILNVSFNGSLSYTFTTVENDRFSLIVDKSDVTKVKNYLESSSIGTLTEYELRKAKSQKSK